MLGPGVNCGLMLVPYFLFMAATICFIPLAPPRLREDHMALRVVSFFAPSTNSLRVLGASAA